MLYYVPIIIIKYSNVQYSTALYSTEHNNDDNHDYHDKPSSISAYY